MQHSFKQRQTHGGENYIVNRQELEAECGESSPVRMAEVALTMASSAGMLMGNSSKGSMSSRLRVRSDRAAKNAPFTTSTNSAKKSMALSASLECHSSRKSLPKVEIVVRTKLAEEEAGRSCMATVFSPACSIMRLQR